MTAAIYFHYVRRICSLKIYIIKLQHNGLVMWLKVRPEERGVQLVYCSGALGAQRGAMKGENFKNTCVFELCLRAHTSVHRGPDFPY